MRARAAWENEAVLIEFLASQLKQGRLAVVLGAGASSGFNLPGWTALVDGLCAKHGVTRTAGATDEMEAESLFHAKYSDNLERFCADIRSILYATYDDSVTTLRSNALLSAIGALVTTSKRGRVDHIVTFNFDDILETYFRYFGLVVEPVSTMPRWATPSDVTIFHPHGYLPYKSAGAFDRLIFTQTDFDRVTGNKSSPWRINMLEAWQSHTCLFIGISGKDPNLRSILEETKTTHVAPRPNSRFWGVWFTDKPSDPYLPVWEGKGVFAKVLSSYADLPTFLFAVCQKAAS